MLGTVRAGPSGKKYKVNAITRNVWKLYTLTPAQEKKVTLADEKQAYNRQLHQKKLVEYKASVAAADAATLKHKAAQARVAKGRALAEAARILVAPRRGRSKKIVPLRSGGKSILSSLGAPTPLRRGRSRK